MPEIPTELHDLRGERLDLRGVRNLIERIVERWNPLQIWLFGSRARGEAGAKSDWDFLVIAPDAAADADLGPLVGWKLQKDARINADIFACRLSEFADDRETPNTLCYEAATNGVLVYER